MSLVFDKHEIEMKPLHDLLRENKMDFTQFLRTVNFVRDMTQEQLNNYIEAYKNGEYDRDEIKRIIDEAVFMAKYTVYGKNDHKRETIAIEEVKTRLYDAFGIEE